MKPGNEPILEEIVVASHILSAFVRVQVRDFLCSMRILIMIRNNGNEAAKIELDSNSNSKSSDNFIRLALNYIHSFRFSLRYVSFCLESQTKMSNYSLCQTEQQVFAYEQIIISSDQLSLWVRLFDIICSFA